MKRLLLLSVAAVMAVSTANAQATLKLAYGKMIEKNSGGKWEKWTKDFENMEQKYGITPTLAITKKIDDEIFTVETYFGGSASGIFSFNVIYDPKKTEELRSKNPNKKITAYRYSGLDDFIWTENTTLDELYKSSSKWTTTADAKIYIWEHSLGSASVFTARNATTKQAAQKKYAVNFKSTRQQIKGTWAEWTKWNTVPNNSYFELSVITENRAYAFKYYEGGSLKKNYTITYDAKATDQKRSEYKDFNSLACYKIDGTKNDYIYLLNTTMGNVLANPDKWANESSAIIMMFDKEKTGNNTRIK